MELCAFSGVTVAGFVAVGLGVITSSNGCVSTCPEGGYKVYHGAFLENHLHEAMQSHPVTLPGQDSPKPAKLERRLKRRGGGRNCRHVWLECRWVARSLVLLLLIHRLARILNP